MVPYVRVVYRLMQSTYREGFHALVAICTAVKCQHTPTTICVGQKTLR